MPSDPLWLSHTQTFPPVDMQFLQTASVSELYQFLLAEMPVIAMRALTELRLNGDEERLKALLQDVLLTTHWMEYALDSQPLDGDGDWAQALIAFAKN